MPPSPVVLDEPAAAAPLASATLALYDSAPQLIPVIITGMSSSIGFFAKRLPNTVLVEHFSRYPSRGMRVREQGRKVRSSKVAQRRSRNVPNPRMEYSPDSAFA